MINLKLIYKIIGSLLFIEAVMLILCLGVAVYYGEDDVFAFSCSVAVSTLAGVLMRLLGRDSDNTLSRRDAYLVVTLTWIVFSLVGTMPFMLGGYLPSFTDAFFETMSGFTTTGATVIDNVESMPHGVLFWRSIMQWIGGLGIVFFTIALLPSLVGGSVKVFAAEATGPICTVGTLAKTAKEHNITKTAVILVGDAVTHSAYAKSRLYAPDFETEFRKIK